MKLTLDGYKNQLELFMEEYKPDSIEELFLTVDYIIKTTVGTSIFQNITEFVNITEDDIQILKKHFKEKYYGD